MTPVEEEPAGLQIGDWPALPPGVGWADGVNVDADDPCLLDSGRRICIAEKRAGGRCGADAMKTELLCAMHGGRADPRLAAQTRHRRAVKARGDAETQAALARLGTRSVVAAALAEKAMEIRDAIHLLADQASRGDVKSAQALIPWLNQGLGMPTERLEHRTPGSRAELEGLETEQLEQIVAERRRSRLHAVDEPAAETA
jgi:hypothetical protein